MIFGPVHHAVNMLRSTNLSGAQHKSCQVMEAAPSKAKSEWIGSSSKISSNCGGKGKNSPIPSPTIDTYHPKKRDIKQNRKQIPNLHFYILRFPCRHLPRYGCDAASTLALAVASLEKSPANGARPLQLTWTSPWDLSEGFMGFPSGLT